jgi:hypothetical protein
MRLYGKLPFLSTLALALLASAAVAAGPKTKIPECSCSMRTPGKWYVVEYYKDEDGLEHLLTSSPHEQPGVNSVPGVQFLRRTLEPDVTATPDEFLSALAAELKNAQVTGPVEAKFGDVPGSKIDVVYSEADKSFFQRYHATVRDGAVYVVIISWADAADLERLEDSAESVRF